MVIFTETVVAVLTFKAPSYNGTTANPTERPPNDIDNYIDESNNVFLFLIWPGLIMVYEAICLLKANENILQSIASLRKFFAVETVDDAREDSIEFFEEIAPVSKWGIFFYKFRHLLANAISRVSSRSDVSQQALLAHISALGFCAMVTAWSIESTCKVSSCGEVYYSLTVVTVIYGLIFTLELVNGFATIYAFIVVLKIIFFKDVMRIVFIYAFVLMGFGSAMFVILVLEQQWEQNPDANFESTLYQTFVSMLGLGGFIDTISGKEAKNLNLVYPSTVHLVRIIFALYIIVSAVVFMNILIAMMNKTYDNIIGIRDTLWCVETLNFIVWIGQDNIIGMRTISRWLANTFVVKTLGRNTVVQYFPSSANDRDKSTREESRKKEMYELNKKLSALTYEVTSKMGSIEQMQAKLSATQDKLRQDMVHQQDLKPKMSLYQLVSKMKSSTMCNVNESRKQSKLKSIVQQASKRRSQSQLQSSTDA